MPEIRVEAPRSSVARSTPATGSVELDAIRSELGDCTRCALSERRRNIVFGVGSPEARLVIVGEAPGRDEDMTGIPFVGRAGQLLTRMLAAIGMAREDAYICNVLKCRPPGNRDPEPQEIATCSPFMGRQVDAIAPKVVLTVGKFASQMVTGLDQRMGQMRGKVFDYRTIPVVPTYHPAYLLRNPSAKGDAYRDLLTVQRLLRAD
jgi:DNA polymerase